MRFWKKYLPASIFAELISFMVLTADLFMPQFSEMLIDYCIDDNTPDTSGMFGFLLTGRFGVFLLVTTTLSCRRITGN